MCPCRRLFNGEMGIIFQPTPRPCQAKIPVERVCVRTNVPSCDWPVESEQSFDSKCKITLKIFQFIY
jgi:hypothetical protein